MTSCGMLLQNLGLDRDAVQRMAGAFTPIATPCLYSPLSPWLNMIKRERRKGEVTFKEWLHAEASRLGITAHALETRIYRGKHPKPKLRVINQRVMFVVPEKGAQ